MHTWFLGIVMWSYHFIPCTSNIYLYIFENFQSRILIIFLQFLSDLRLLLLNEIMIVIFFLLNLMGFFQ